MAQILSEIPVDIVYVGQLERLLHADAVFRLEGLEAAGTLTPLFENERTTIYRVNLP
jgi:uncharacterized membrane protein